METSKHTIQQKAGVNIHRTVPVLGLPDVCLLIQITTKDMRVCMQVCVYASMCVCKYVCMQVCVHMSMCACEYVCMRVCVYASMCAYEYVCM